MLVSSVTQLWMKPIPKDSPEAHPWELRATGSACHEPRCMENDVNQSAILSATGYKLQATSYKLQATSYKLQAANPTPRLYSVHDWFGFLYYS